MAVVGWSVGLWPATSAEEAYNLGRKYFVGEDDVVTDYAEAVRWYRIAAEQSHADAQVQLGIMYYMGFGVPKNDVLGLMWLIIAGRNGYDAKVLEAMIQGLQGISQTEVIRAGFLSEPCIESGYEDCG